MFKNKDGSYNKISIILSALIILITIGIIGSTIYQTTEIPSVDQTQLIIIGLIGITLLIAYIMKDTIIKKLFNHTKQIETPITNKIDPYIQQTIKKNASTQEAPKEKPSGSWGIGSWGIISLIVTFITGGTIFLISGTILNSILTSMPAIPATSELTSAQTNITNTVATALDLIPMIVIVSGAVIIISAMSILKSD